MRGQYENPRNQRRDAQTYTGRFRGGKLVPVAAHVMRGNETATIDETINIQLDPIPGELLTPITAELVTVYVPVQAMHALAYPNEALSSSDDVIRDKLVTGQTLFGLENENEISKRIGIRPVSIAGQKMVSQTVRLAHNAAVNYLRREKFVNAAQLAGTNAVITPALFGQSVLERFNAVLDPDDRINGAVRLTGEIPVSGIGHFRSSPAVAADNLNVPVYQNLEPVETSSATYGKAFAAFSTDPSDAVYIRASASGHYTDVHADLAGSNTAIRVKDFWAAERIDGLTRQFRAIVDANPEFGEELILRLSKGLSLDLGDQPVVLNRKEMIFGDVVRHAMDGPNLSQQVTDMYVTFDHVVPVPATEFGGIVMTFVAVKPDETLSSQPHPFFTEPWGAINFTADELAIDPVPVTLRELRSDVPAGNEGDVAFYTGNNGMKKEYRSYGFNRYVDVTTLDAEIALWQAEIPLSVTPQTVIYPETLNHNIFAVTAQTYEPVRYTASSRQAVSTPIIFGETPVETLGVLDGEDIFEQGA